MVMDTNLFKSIQIYFFLLSANANSPFFQESDRKNSLRTTISRSHARTQWTMHNKNRAAFFAYSFFLSPLLETKKHFTRNIATSWCQSKIVDLVAKCKADFRGKL